MVSAKMNESVPKFIGPPNHQKLHVDIIEQMRSILKMRNSSDTKDPTVYSMNGLAGAMCADPFHWFSSDTKDPIKPLHVVQNNRPNIV